MKNYALTVMIALFAICQSAKAQLPAFTLKSMDGKEVHISKPHDAIKNGIAMVNEDRRTYGLVLGRNIHENVALVNMKKYTKVLIDDKKISDDVDSAL